MAASLADEQLAIRVRDGLAAFRPRYEEWRPFAIELHARFEARKKAGSGTEILGCRTWKQFCEEVLHYSARHVRRLMEGENPAGKYRNQTPRNVKTVPSQPSAFAESTFAGTVPPSVEWSDSKIIRTCVRFVQSVLKPLERLDPQRFHRLAVAIAKEIAGDFVQDDVSVS